METKHTPGPWHASNSGPDSHNQALIISEATGANVAVAYAREDMSLIAAAPDLLEALELAQTTIQRIEPDHTHGPFSTVRGTLDAIRTALAKARGEA